MSLLLDAFENCIMMDKTTTSDGRGGFITSWTDGAEFDAAIVFDSSMQARAAEAAGVKSLYTITTAKNVNLQYHDVFRRLSDGKIFRVTSDGDDKKTPPSATINMRQVTAEEFVPAE
jgi:SPP1 family predicted phage head-tail adaptor